MWLGFRTDFTKEDWIYIHFVDNKLELNNNFVSTPSSRARRDLAGTWAGRAAPPGIHIVYALYDFYKILPAHTMNSSFYCILSRIKLALSNMIEASMLYVYFFTKRSAIEARRGAAASSWILWCWIVNSAAITLCSRHDFWREWSFISLESWTVLLLHLNVLW